MAEEENFGLICGFKDVTFRKENYTSFKLLGNYLAKNGMFDQFPIAHILIIGLEQTSAVIDNEMAHRLGFNSKEEYFSHNFNGFCKNDASKTLTKCEFINLDLLYGYIDELDDFIDSELEKKWKIKFN
jgi:hypothetical protein